MVESLDHARASIPSYSARMRTSWKTSLLVAMCLSGCDRTPSDPPVVLPDVAPDAVVVAWSVTSRSADRDSVHAVLEGDRTLTVTNRTPNGTMMSVSRTVSDGEYAELVASLRDLDCCSLRSTSEERSSPGEAKPVLEIDLGDVQCEIELWDHQWREGLARQCGLAVARLHKAGFVPDPPFDDTPP